MPKTRSATRPALTISDLQAVERDFAFVVDQSVEAITLVNAAKGADKVLIEEVQVFDEFIGGSLAEGLKSLAFTVRLQPKDTTLKDLEIEVSASRSKKCERCWHYVEDIGRNSEHPTICKRCISNLFEEGEKRKHA